MDTSDRRTFLKLIGSPALAAALPLDLSRALAIPAHNRTGTIADVEHIVILMQENRSFDHYFGTMRGVRGFADPRAVKLPSGKSVWHQPHESGASPAIPSQRRGPWHDVSAGPAPWLERHACRLERGQIRSMGTEQGCDDHDLSHPKGPSVPVCAGGCLHHLRQLSLLADGADRPQSLSHVDRLGRQRRRRPAAPSSRTPKLATIGPPIPSASKGPVSPGRSTRTSASVWTRRVSGAGPTTPTSAITATTRSSTSISISSRYPEHRLPKERRPEPTSWRTTVSRTD